MLLYSIKKKLPFLDAMDNLGERWRNRANAQLPALPPAVESKLENECAMPWNKIEFLRWFDQAVMHKFHVDDLVTWAHIPEQMNTIPLHCKITYVNELHHTIRFNKKLQEPKVLCIRHMTGNVMSVAPGEVRHLTDKEKELVDLSNRKTQGNA